MLLSDLKDVLFGSFEAHLASDDAVTSFATDVDDLAKKIARNLDQRYISIFIGADFREDAVQELGTIDGEDIWNRLGRYWSFIDAELDPTTDSKLSEETIIDLGTMLAKLERNLIAGLGSHQEAALYVTRHSRRI